MKTMFAMTSETRKVLEREKTTHPSAFTTELIQRELLGREDVTQAHLNTHCLPDSSGSAVWNAG